MMTTTKREECRLLFIRIEMKRGSLFEAVAADVSKKTIDFGNGELLPEDALITACVFMWRVSGARCWDCMASLIESDVRVLLICSS